MKLLSWLCWQRVPAAEMRIDAPRGELALSLGFALFYILAAAVTGLVIRAQPVAHFGAWKFNQDVTYLFGFKAGLLLLVPCAWAWWRGYRPADLLAGWRFGPRALPGLVLAVVVGFCLNLSHLDGIGRVLATEAPEVWLLPLAAGIVLPLFTAGLPEEIVYRGLLQTRIERLWGRLAAILVAAVLFTLWHLPTRYLLASGVEGSAGDLGSVLVGTGLPVLIVGLFFGVAWDRWRNLPALVAVHWAIDVLPYVSSFLGIEF